MAQGHIAQITTKARGYNKQTHRGDQKTVTDTQGRCHEPRGIQQSLLQLTETYNKYYYLYTVMSKDECKA